MADTLSLVVERPAAGGEMIARAAGTDGPIVFVSGAIPGERVTARVERVAKGIARARVVAVEEPSPDRRAPPGDPLCGGCLYNHIAYPRQLAIKGQVIADAFARIGKIAIPAPVAIAPSPEDGYRMRARLHVRGRGIGFFREGTHEICDIRQTRQLLPATCDALDRLAAAVRSLGADAIREIELSENLSAVERVVHFETAAPIDRRSLDALAATDGFTHGPYVTDTVTVDGKAFSLRRHVLAFFQGNRYLLRDLAAHVVERVPLGSGLVDLYAGTGLFAIAASTLRGASVIAIEGDRVAADDLMANAAAVGGRITTTRGDVESFAALAGPVETMIVDPPRTGMTTIALEGALRAAPRRLIYVSCDVATLARDARRIVAAGYAIDRLDGFDLFPNTPHVETVVVFDRGREQG